MKFDVLVRGAALTAAVMVASAIAPAIARDKPKPPPPCPLSSTLRVADAASIAGLQSLSMCSGNVIAAPASASEYDAPPAQQRIAPEEPRIRRASSPISVASAIAPDVASATRVAFIAPLEDEPVEFAASAPMSVDGNVSDGNVSGDAILAMRPMSYKTPYDTMITRVAMRHRVDPLLLHAVITQESRYRVSATSHVGARGLMQLMPGTARMLGVTQIADAESNVDGGARLLRKLHQRYGDFNLTLAAYNAGEGAVQKYGNKVPPYRETQNYVQQVMNNYRRLVAEQGLASR